MDILREDMLRLLNSNTGDLNLECCDETDPNIKLCINVHSNILLNSTTYFNVANKCISLNQPLQTNLKRNIIIYLVKYIYIKVSENIFDNIEDNFILLDTTRMWMLSSLLTTLTRRVKNSINETNMLLMLELADQYKFEDIYNHALQYIVCTLQTKCYDSIFSKGNRYCCKHFYKVNKFVPTNYCEQGTKKHSRHCCESKPRVDLEILSSKNLLALSLKLV